ncbi:hypothetical protein TSOC_012172 [Tetrabaena socialis]|uniref:DUF3593 domain-containing protein n=1 Tax=Tetrabaena socialis TaxID=47790 RepID=A0A2J7ZNQ0_9CHLO|nr:hypothetical protein TSOC_012172 [Tetrabaena socialis]|eukprot:PNH01896.1 hypothetical protein TSOC_012172 [Tetrabaena socialis]
MRAGVLSRAHAIGTRTLAEAAIRRARLEGPPQQQLASVAPQLFAMSLFPYLAFLFFLTKSGKTPPLTLFGFYFLLVFVGATIPAGIYAKSHYGTSLANVDWLHGTAESLLTVTNLFIVLGLRQGIREAEAAKAAPPPVEGAALEPEEASMAKSAEDVRAGVK